MAVLFYCKKGYDIRFYCMAIRGVVRNSINAILYDNCNNCDSVLGNTSIVAINGAIVGAIYKEK